jgi:hypothetical protein
MGCVMVNVRVQVDFSEERVAELEKLMRLCGLNTKKELLNNALTLFEWAVREVTKGRAVASIDETTDRYRELHLPALQYAAHHGAEPQEQGAVRARY